MVTADDLDNSKERSKIGITTSGSLANLIRKFFRPMTSNVSGEPLRERRFLELKIALSK